MGMCAFGKGVACTAVTGKTNQSCLMDTFVKLIVAHCQSGSFTSDAVRFICNAIGLRVPTGLPANDSVHILVSAYEVLRAWSLTTFDLLDFLTLIHNSSQHNLLFWCSGHGIYCKAFWTLAVIKDTLITHVIQNDCSSCWFSSPDHSHAPGHACLFCDDVALQIRPSHPNVDHTAFFLSLTCLSPGVHASTLKSILDIARGYPHVVGRASFVWEELKAHIYSICKGKLVYQSILRGLLKNECQLTELNCAANLWPLLTKQPLHARIEDLFETQIIANSTFSITCASCSVRYMSRGLTHVPLSDINLAILEMPDGWVPLHSDRSQHGPLVNLLLDKNGVFNVRNDAIELTLCTDCCCTYCSCTNSPNWSSKTWLQKTAHSSHPGLNTTTFAPEQSTSCASASTLMTSQSHRTEPERYPPPLLLPHSIPICTTRSIKFMPTMSKSFCNQKNLLTSGPNTLLSMTMNHLP